MDSIFVIPQMSGVSFAYTRLPHVSHGVFCAGPIGGTFAVPPNPSDAIIVQLTAQHLAQSRLYGAAPTAAAHVPPPPRRGRSHTRGVSRVRAASVDPPALTRVGVLMCLGPLLFVLFPASVLDPDIFPLTRMGLHRMPFYLLIELRVLELKGRLARLPLYGNNSRRANNEPAIGPLTANWATSRAFPLFTQLTRLGLTASEVNSFLGRRKCNDQPALSRHHPSYRLETGLTGGLPLTFSAFPST